MRSSTLPSISVTTEEAAFSSRAVLSAWIAALTEAISNGRTSERAEVSTIFCNTGQSNVIVFR